ncbi:DegV family protein [Cardiobacteriaceae bacterium TAE3-ERU3]|nr:DegV family protein [Cardiobacteriaceae bacterium TAE3-ERU3]
MKDWIVAADSTSCLDFVQVEHNIETLPLYLHMHGKRLRDVIDISSEDFIRWMIKYPEELPYSSPPETKDIVLLYEGWVKRGIKKAILITLSSRISETYQRALRIAQQYRDRIHIEVFDSRTTLYGQAMLALEAEKQMSKGIPLAAVIAQLEYLRSHSRVYFTVGKLDYLIKNGRLSPTKGMIGRLFNIKPIMYFDSSGTITPVDKVRKLTSAQSRIINQVKQFIGPRKAQIYVMRSLDKAGEDFEQTVSDTFPDHEVISLPPSPVIACHTGPALYGFGTYIPY